MGHQAAPDDRVTDSQTNSDDQLAAYGLAAGEYGVRRTTELLIQELRILMVLAGIPAGASLTSDVVARRL